jgi:3-oxoacyl-[acyl-carrier-protein] synthase II
MGTRLNAFGMYKTERGEQKDLLNIGVEAVITVMSIKNNILTPTINYNPDPELDLDYVPNQARETDVNIALSNSFAFGGHNACLVLKQYS